MTTEDDTAALLKRLIDIVKEISAISGFRSVVSSQCRDLTRRLKLLAPLFEELMDIRGIISEQTMNGLMMLREAMDSAKELLGFCSRGSKILLVLKLQKVMNKFQELAFLFAQALSFVSYEKLDIPDELKEQVGFVQSQFHKVKERFEAIDMQLSECLLSIFNQNSNMDTESGLTSKLCEKLELKNVKDLKEELLALDEMVGSNDWDVEVTREIISVLNKKFEEYLWAENPNSSTHDCQSRFDIDRACTSQSPRSRVVPDDFRCPISLELMKDPVIICTGQTYERTSIQKWIERGHQTCPKTQQRLSGTTLIPNYVLSSIITHWCEANGVDPPRRFGETGPGSSLCSIADVDINTLVSRLTSSNVEDQRNTAGKLRLLAKNNSNNRKLIAQAGAIPLLVGLLSTPDTVTQEHIVTSLLNLSIYEDNKRRIIYYDAIPGILHVLKNGSMQARENAAATLFSLTSLEEFRETIGASGAIPPLITLLREGSRTGKKDSAEALFILCLHPNNKVLAVRAGLVPLLLAVLTESGGAMVEEALVIVAVLASNSEGKREIRRCNGLPIIVELIRSGSPKSKENAASVLVHLGGEDQKYLSEARSLGVVDLLKGLAENGSDRGKRKAAELLKILGN